MADGLNAVQSLHVRIILEAGNGEKNGSFAPGDLLLCQHSNGKIGILRASALRGYAAKPGACYQPDSPPPST